MGVCRAEKVKVEDKTIQELVCCVLISPRDCSAVSNLFDITYADSYGNQIPVEGYQKQFSKFFYQFHQMLYRVFFKPSIR